MEWPISWNDVKNMWYTLDISERVLEASANAGSSGATDLNIELTKDEVNMLTEYSSKLDRPMFVNASIVGFVFATALPTDYGAELCMIMTFGDLHMVMNYSVGTSALSVHFSGNP